MTDLGLLITKPFVIQNESSSVDLGLQDTINCVLGRTAPAVPGLCSEKRKNLSLQTKCSPPHLSPSFPSQACSDQLTLWDGNLATVICLCCKEVIQIAIIPTRNINNLKVVKPHPTRKSPQPLCLPCKTCIFDLSHQLNNRNRGLLQPFTFATF